MRNNTSSQMLGTVWDSTQIGKSLSNFECVEAQQAHWMNYDKRMDTILSIGVGGRADQKLITNIRIIVKVEDLVTDTAARSGHSWELHVGGASGPIALQWSEQCARNGLSSLIEEEDSSKWIRKDATSKGQLEKSVWCPNAILYEGCRRRGG